MRGVVVLFLFLFVTVIYVAWAGPVVEEVGGVAKEQENIDSGQFDGTDQIDGMTRSLLIWVPLLLIGGGFAFAVRWYIQRERNIRRAGP